MDWAVEKGVTQYCTMAQKPKLVILACLGYNRNCLSNNAWHFRTQTFSRFAAAETGVTNKTKRHGCAPCEFFQFQDLAIVPAGSWSWLARTLQWNEDIITCAILTITSQNVCFMKGSIACIVCRLQSHLFCTGSEILTGMNSFQVTQRRYTPWPSFSLPSEPSCLGEYKRIPLKRRVSERCCIF